MLSAIEATADLLREHRLDAGDLRSIRVGIPKIIQGRLTVGEPKDVQAAQMSLPYCMAMVVKQGKAVPAGFTINIDDFDGALADPSVMAIPAVAQRIERELGALLWPQREVAVAGEDHQSDRLAGVDARRIERRAGRNVEA